MFERFEGEGGVRGLRGRRGMGRRHSCRRIKIASREARLLILRGGRNASAP